MRPETYTVLDLSAVLKQDRRRTEYAVMKAMHDADQ